MDNLTTEKRSQRMRLVKSKGTGPERIVEGIVRHLNYSYESHQKSLPGSPDLTFPKQKKVIYVHGCFWHQHTVCRNDGKPRSPKSRHMYWRNKLFKNQKRDINNQRKLNRMGWRYLVVWECQTQSKAKMSLLLERIKTFLKRVRNRKAGTRPNP